MIYRKLTDFDHVIWDWNGTLINDIELVHAVTTQQLLENGLPFVSIDYYRAHFTHPLSSFLSLLGFDFETIPMSAIANRFGELYEARLHQVSLHPETRKVLEHLKVNRVGQSILSAHNQVGLSEAVEYFDISDYFDRILGLADNRAHSKVELGSALFNLLGLRPDRVVMVGDTDHDLEVAASLGIECRLVGRGFQKIERLRKLNAVVVESIEELI